MAELEALAYLRVVQFALEIGLTKVVLEGDSVAVLMLFGMGRVSSPAMGMFLMIFEFKFLLFQFFYFNLVSHLCNFVADTLAKKASSVMGLQVWLGDLLADIAPFVLRDAH